MTVEGETFPLPQPFHVLATANPIEYEGTYPLPEAQLDRFLLRVAFGYPDAEEESTCCAGRLERRQEDRDVRPASPTPPGCSPCRRPSRTSPSTPSVGRYCVELARATRDARAHRAWGLATRLARPDAARPRVCRAARTRLRHPGGRQVRRAGRSSRTGSR